MTPAAWLRSKASLAGADARQTVRAARLVRRNENLAKAMAAADITAGHVGTLARHVTPARADLFDTHADVLIDGARTLSLDDTAAMARRWAAYADDQLGRGEPDERHGRRGVWFHHIGDQTEGRVLGIPEQLAALRAALDRLEPPDPTDTPGGPRSLAQRRYDALVHLASLGAQHRRGRVDPDHTVNIVIDSATLAGDRMAGGTSNCPSNAAGVNAA